MTANDIRAMITSMTDGVRVSAPAQIESFDGEAMRADVALKHRDQAGNAPVIVDVPVATLRAGGVIIRPAYQRGDEVQLVFSDRDNEAGLFDENARQPVRVSAHRLDYAVVMAGNTVESESISIGGGSDSLVIGVEDSTEYVEVSPAGDIIIHSDTVNIGRGELRALIQETAQDLINTHTHTVPSGSSSGPTTAPNESPLVAPDDLTEDVSAS